MTSHPSEAGPFPAELPERPADRPAPRPTDLPADLLRDIFRQELLEHGPALYVADLDGRLLWTNGAFRRLSAAAEAGPQGLLPIERIAAEIAVLGGTVFRDDAVRIGRALHRLRSYHVALHDENDRPKAVAGLVQAVPDESQRLETIALLREKLDDVTRLMSDWIWEADTELRLTSVSHRVVEVLGFHPRELIGRGLLGLGAVGAAHDAIPARFRDRAPFRNLPFEAATKNGEMRQFLLSAVPVFSQKTGELAGYRGTATDVTELRRRELSLQKAKEMAETESRAKTEFLANVSHELRTPLNAIIGFSEIMQMELLGPVGNQQYHGYVGDIHESAKHLLGLINDILDVAKIEAGKADLIEQEMDLRRMIEAVARLIRERAVRAQVELEVAVAPDLPPILADERKLKQILINLLSNAIKFTPAGGQAKVEARLDAAGDLLLIVSDTGIGIGPEDLERVMEPFGQVDSRLNRRYDGTGLGLPLTRGLVELHGGTVTLESKLGAGTTVVVRLPAVRLLRR